MFNLYILRGLKSSWLMSTEMLLLSAPSMCLFMFLAMGMEKNGLTNNINKSGT